MATSFNKLINDKNIEICSFKVPFKILGKKDMVIKLKATVTYPRDIRMYLKAYLDFLSNDEIVKEVLECDQCYIYADKYLLAMTFRYLIRVGVEPASYCPYLFFVALFLAHDMAEEGLLYAKDYFYRLATGKNNPKGQIRFNKTKWQLFKLLDYQASVPTEWCERLFGMFPEHPMWQRTREEAHGGATRIQLLPMPGGGSVWDWAIRPMCWRCASFTRPGQPQSSELKDLVMSTEKSCSEGSQEETSSNTLRDSWGSLLQSDNTSVDDDEDEEEEEEVEDDVEMDDDGVMIID